MTPIEQPTKVQKYYFTCVTNNFIIDKSKLSKNYIELVERKNKY